MNKKMILFGAVMLAAFCIGIFFLASPSLNRQAHLNEQADLLERTDALMPAYVSVETPIEMPAVEDKADVEEIEDTTQRADNEPVDEESLDTTPVFTPLDTADFPRGITPIGILTIDSIDLRLPVKEGATEPELRVAPGRVIETAQVGEIGNAVIAGHRNYTFGSMFNRMGEVEIGDVIEFQAMSGEIFTFEVFEVLVINPDDQIAFIQPQNESIITLYTCTPIRVATHRLLVRARQIEGGLFSD